MTVGTVFERSKIALTKWWMAAHMFNSGKNGVSAHEIHRTLKVTYKTVWFMMHRLREAMADLNPTHMGDEGKSIQGDETYYGHSSKSPFENEIRGRLRGNLYPTLDAEMQEIRPVSHFDFGS